MPRPEIMGRNSTDNLEQDHVYSIYDQIAPCFSEISQKAWPNVRRFLKRLQPGSLVADIGCGNGRYLHINKSIFKIGLDICCPLVECAKTKGHEVLVADNLKLPFKSNMFDAVISIGVIHHFATSERRIEAVRELARILRPGGQMMLYVWAYEQKHRKFDGQDVLIPWHGGEKTNKSGPVLWPSCSDKDLSSVSSISEDESSADTTDSTFSGNTLQRTASETFKDTLEDSLLEKDNVFWTDNSLSKFTISRQRSNTLPSILNHQGHLSPSVHRWKHGHSSSILAEECRKVEASLKALSASHNNCCSVDPEEGISFQVSALEENTPITLQNTSGKQNGDKCFTNGESHPHVKQTYHKSAGQKRSDGCQMDSGSPPRHMVLHADQPSCHIDQNQSSENQNVRNKHSKNFHNGHFQLEIHHFPREKQEKKSFMWNSKKESPKKSSKKEDISLFDLIKTKIKKVFDIDPPQKPLESPDEISKSLAVENWLLNSCVDASGALGDLSTSTSMEEFEGFAVREFPQSSCPTNRNSLEILEMKQDDEMCVNGSLDRLQTSVHSHKNGVRLVGDTSKKVNGLVSENELKSKPEAIFYNSKGQPQTKKFDKPVKLHGCEKSAKVSIFNGINDEHHPNQNGYHSTICDSFPRTHIKAHDQNRKSHACSKNNLSCDHNCALETLCTNTFISGNKENGEFSISQNYPKERKSVVETSRMVMEQSSGVQKYVHRNGHDQSRRSILSKAEMSKSLQNLNKRSVDSVSDSSLQKKTLATNVVDSSSSQNTVTTQTFTNTTQPSTVTTQASTVTTQTSKQLCRYYHVFKEGELTEMIHQHVHCLRVVSTMFDHSNWCIVLEKR